jgi:hypothetical protein
MTELTSENIAEVASKQAALIQKITQPSLTNTRTLMTVGQDNYAISMANREQWLEEVEYCTDFSPVVPQSQIKNVFDYKSEKEDQTFTTVFVSGSLSAVGGLASSVIFIPEGQWALMLLAVFVGTPTVAILLAGGLTSFIRRGLKKSDWALDVVAKFTAKGFRKWLLRQHSIQISLEASTRLIKEMLFSGPANKSGCNITRDRIQYHFEYDKLAETIRFVDKEVVPSIVQNGSITSLVRTKIEKPDLQDIALPSEIEPLYAALLAEVKLLFATNQANEAARIQKQLDEMVSDYRKVAHLDDEGLAAQKLMTVVSLLQDDVKALKRKVLEAGLANLDIHRKYLISRQKLQGTAHAIQIKN